MKNKKLENELIAKSAEYISDLATVIMPTSDECARCVIHAIEDLGYEIRQHEASRTISEEVVNKAVECGVIQGMAIVAANAARHETWRAHEILGGVTVADMQMAGVEDYDIKPIRQNLLSYGKKTQAKRLSKAALATLGIT